MKPVSLEGKRAICAALGFPDLERVTAVDLHLDRDECVATVHVLVTDSQARLLSDALRRFSLVERE